MNDRETITLNRPAPPAFEVAVEDVRGIALAFGMNPATSAMLALTVGLMATRMDDLLTAIGKAKSAEGHQTR